MKKSILLPLFLLFGMMYAFSQNYMQITTIESIIPGGLGRSRMIVTDPSGKQTETELKNFYSMVGINLENIKSNDSGILKTLNDYAKDGWRVAQVTAGTQSPSEQYPQGIFITRYLMEKQTK